MDDYEDFCTGFMGGVANAMEKYLTEQEGE